MGSRSGEAPLASRRARTLAWSSLVALAAFSLPWTVHPWYDPTNDGSMYIATARALVAGEGYSFLGIPFVIRPPGYPLLIAPLLALRGTDFYALNLLSSLCGLLGVVAFHFLLRARLGLLLATLVPLVLWFNPGYQRLCNQVMSDVPGWAALVGCLLLAARLRTRPGARGSLVLGVVLGLATLLRSGNLLLVPALVVADLLRAWRGAPAEPPAVRTPARAWLVQSAALVLGVLLVLGPWGLRNRAVAAPPPADQTLLYSYSSGMWNRDMGDPRSPRLGVDEVLARVPEQGAKLLRTLGTALAEGEVHAWTVPLAWILLAVLCVQAARRRAEEELFALATVLVVAVYFGYAGRLLLPVFAFALVGLVELVRDGAARLGGARAGMAAGALLCVAWLALAWNPRMGWREIEGLHEAYVESARRVNARLAPEARLGAYRGWHHAVFLERPVFSFEHACERASGPEAARSGALDPAGVGTATEEIIDKYGLDTVLVTELGLPPPVQRAERAFAAQLARRYGAPEDGAPATRLVRVR